MLLLSLGCFHGNVSGKTEEAKSASFPRHLILNETIAKSFVVAENKAENSKLVVYYSCIIGSGDNKTYSEEASVLMLSNAVLYENNNIIAVGAVSALAGKVIMQNSKESSCLYDFLNEMS